jgi:hypothetical protein
MELIIRLAIGLLWLCVLSCPAVAQEQTKAQPTVAACVNGIQIQNVLVTLEESDLSNMYVKWFGSGVPLDNGTGIRQERAIVPGGASVSESQMVLTFTASAKGETQIRRKSWMGLADSVIVVVRDGVIIFTDEDVVKGIPQLSEVQVKCF